jgi:DNA (cytosine-5)-methyltransferase 1
MSAYYNEFDPGAAAWLRELMKRGLIADGEVDDRSILEVQPDDLRGYTQCHFFAGVGVWSYALRNAGWPDDRPVWTASLPCQPFSAAGKGLGAQDERNLCEVWLRLAAECRPATCLGEQVEPAIKLNWLDALFISLEQSGYACGALVFPACSVGAPHIRSRLYWVADNVCDERDAR